MTSILVFPDLTKIHDFRWKNANVTRNQEVCHVIYAFLKSSLRMYNCAKFHQCRICMTDFREGEPFCRPSSHLWEAPKRLILNRVKKSSNVILVIRLLFKQIAQGIKYFIWTNKTRRFAKRYMLRERKVKTPYETVGITAIA